MYVKCFLHLFGDFLHLLINFDKFLAQKKREAAPVLSLKVLCFIYVLDKVYQFGYNFSNYFNVLVINIAIFIKANIFFIAATG